MLALLGANPEYGFPNFRAFNYIWGHMALIVAQYYAINVFDWKITKEDYKRTILFILPCILITLILDKIFTETNWMFLNHSPILDEKVQNIFGGFYVIPYILGMFALYYIPVMIEDYKNKK